MVYNLVGVIWNIEYIAAFDNMTILWSVTACHGWNKDWLFPHFTKYHPNYSVWIMTTSMEGARNIWRCLIWIKITRNWQDVVSVERRPGRCDQWWHWLACCGPRVWQLTGVCGAPGCTAPRRRAPLLRRVLTTTTISLQNISRHHRDWRLLVQMSDCSQQHNVSQPASWWLVILHNEHSSQQRRFKQYLALLIKWFLFKELLVPFRMVQRLLLSHTYLYCVCLQTLLLLMPPSIRARMMAAVYLPPGVWPYSVQWRRHRIMWTLRPVSSRHMSPCSPGWATPPLLLRPCPPAYHLWSPLHRAASQQIGPDNCRHVSPLNLKQGCSEVRSCTKGESKQQSLNCYIHFYNIYLK